MKQNLLLLVSILIAVISLSAQSLNFEDFENPNYYNNTSFINSFDVLGNEIIELVNEELAAGSYSVTLNTGSIQKPLSSGIYFYRLESNNFVETKKLMLIK